MAEQKKKAPCGQNLRPTATAIATAFVVLAMLGSQSRSAAAEGGGKTKREPPPPARVAKLIAQLNAPKVGDREKAQAELAALGPAVLPYVKQALKSKVPEIAARARLLYGPLLLDASVPKKSWAELLPENALLLLEIPDTQRALTRWKTTPVTRLWRTAGVREWWKKVLAAAEDEDRAAVQAVEELRRLVSGKFSVSYDSPEMAESFDPPYIFFLESRNNPGQAETALRKLWKACDSAPEDAIPHGPFTVEEHGGMDGYSLFGRTSYLFCRDEEGMNKALERLQKPPKKNLLPAFTPAAKLLPEADVLVYAARKGLDKVAEGGWHGLDDMELAFLDGLGWTPPAVLWGAARLRLQGIEEVWQARVVGKEGLLPFLRGVPRAAPPGPGEPEALDVVPAYAAALITLNFDLSANGEAFFKAWERLEATVGAVAVPRGKKRTGAEKTRTKRLPVVGRKDKNDKAAVRLEKAGTGKQDKPAKKAAPPRPSLKERWEKRFGVSPLALAAHCRGAVRIGVFFRKIGTEEPDEMPVEYLIACTIKDAAGLRKLLEAGAKKIGEEPADFRKGRFYPQTHGGEKTPGFWLRDGYLVWTSYRRLLGPAADALERKKGRRFADRPDYKKLLEEKALDRKALVVAYADGRQLLQLPYALAGVLWEDGPCDQPWPKFAELKPHLTRVLLQLTATEDGVLLRARSPLSLAGLYAVFATVFEEAAF